MDDIERGISEKGDKGEGVHNTKESKRHFSTGGSPSLNKWW